MAERCSACKRERPTYIADPSCELGGYCAWVQAWGPDWPMAVKGLTSYRYQGRFGWVMIGAKDDADALVQAERSISETPVLENLQVWAGREYVPAKGRTSDSPP